MGVRVGDTEVKESEGLFLDYRGSNWMIEVDVVELNLG